jgi:alginate O-acetyltransferase complex protein AlgI
MLFNSYIFIFLFLPVVLAGFAIFRRAPNSNLLVGWLILASIFYYGWWKPEFLWLLATSIIVNLAFGKLLMSGRLSKPQARLTFIAGVTFNLALLGFFKYANFFVANVDFVFGVEWDLPHILLPIGISFITFQKIAFLVDAYRGEVKNFSTRNYIFFVTFFPQLIAGPIVHHAEIMPQLSGVARRDFTADFSIGASIFIVGLFKKVVIADSLAVYADAGYGSLHAGQSLDFASAWVTALSYSFQLYYDFSGYSDMAVGLARMFGIKLPVNFFSPYKARSIVEFWRRWHMTLSRFLRDYLYFPLGGNRRGTFRRYLNLAVVMLLGGLWHGANWTFVVWGGVHGALLIANHAWSSISVSRTSILASRPFRAIAVGVTFLAVTLAWVPFRAASVGEARVMLGYLIGSRNQWISSLRHFVAAQFSSDLLLNVETWFKPRELWPPVLPPDYLATAARPVGWLLLFVAVGTFLAPNTYQLFGRFEPALGLSGWLTNDGVVHRLGVRAAFVLAALFVIAVLGLSRVSPFLYFQF